MSEFSVEAELLKLSATHFFNDTNAPQRWQCVQKYINGNRGESGSVSMRLLDHLVVCYARSRNVTWIHRGNLFNVYHSAQTLLHGLQKWRMDPFCRVHENGGDTFIFHGVKTTAAQLTFFRWAVNHGVLDYVEKHHAEIRADMKVVAVTSDTRKRTLLDDDDDDDEENAADPDDLVMKVSIEAHGGGGGGGYERIEAEQAEITNKECLQRPRKRRKRLCDKVAPYAVHRVAPDKEEALVTIA